MKEQNVTNTWYSKFYYKHGIFWAKIHYLPISEFCDKEHLKLYYFSLSLSMLLIILILF